MPDSPAFADSLTFADVTITYRRLLFSDLDLPGYIDGVAEDVLAHLKALDLHALGTISDIEVVASTEIPARLIEAVKRG